MKYIFFIAAFIISLPGLVAQEVMTPEKLWELGRVSAMGISNDGNSVVYRVTTPSVSENTFSSKYYTVSLQGGNPTEVENHSELYKNKNLSPDGKHLLYHEAVKVQKVLGKD